MSSAPERSDRWLIYALGGGLGHLTRSVALARAATKVGYQTCILTNCPYAELLALQDELGPNGTVVTLDPTLTRHEVANNVHGLLRREAFDALIVDTFPRGLGGELAELLSELTIPKILIHRDLNPRYVDQFKLDSVAILYDRIILPGESAAFETMPHADTTKPWLMRDDHELLSGEDARRILKAGDCDLPIIAVVGCGKPTETLETATLAAQLLEELGDSAIVRFVSPRADDLPKSDVDSVCVWPFLQVLAAVSIVVGSGGYNTVQEARATQTPLVAIPRKRLYDRQDRRLRPTEIAVDVEHAVQKVKALVQTFSNTRPNHSPRYQNGVHEAVRIIEQTCTPIQL